MKANSNRFLATKPYYTLTLWFFCLPLNVVGNPIKIQGTHNISITFGSTPDVVDNPFKTQGIHFTTCLDLPPDVVDNPIMIHNIYLTFCPIWKIFSNHFMNYSHALTLQCIIIIFMYMFTRYYTLHNTICILTHSYSGLEPCPHDTYQNLFCVSCDDGS